MFALAWFDRHTLLGQGSRGAAVALSCVTLGWLLAAVTPPGWLKLGILAMAVADCWLVLSDLLQTPNNVLVAAVPAPHSGLHLPQLQTEPFGSDQHGLRRSVRRRPCSARYSHVNGASSGPPALLTL